MSEILTIDQKPLPIIGEKVQTPYNLHIPDKCTANQLGIFLTGFLRSMDVGFAFTDEEFAQIHPKIRSWFVPTEAEEFDNG